MRMKLVLLVIIVAALAGCATPGDKPATTAPSAAAVSQVPVNQYCIMDPNDLIDPTITCVYNGKTYGFCCPDCRKEFLKDPAKYVAAANANPK
jgi:hypothetical protein